MAALIYPNFSLNITPLFDNEDAGLISFESTEKVNGFMADIVVKMKTFKDITQLEDVHHIKLVNKDGTSFECDAYVYYVGFTAGVNTIKLLACTPKFMREVHTSTFKGGESVISSLYPNKIDKTVKSDLMSSLPLYQQSESDYKFLTRVMRAYKHNTIFAYTLGGLVVRDLSAYKAVMELNRQGDTKVRDGVDQELLDPKRYSSPVEILERFTNHIKVRIHEEIFDVNKEYESLIGNLGFFQRFEVAKSLYNFTASEIYSANVGEGIDYYSTETKVNQTFISSRVIKIQGTSLSVDYSLMSINPQS